jgi:hypothetical protein
MKRQSNQETVRRIQIVKNNLKNSSLKAYLNSLKSRRQAMMIQRRKKMVLNLMALKNMKESLSKLITATIV